MDSNTLKVVKTLTSALAAYHRHEVFGLENIPQSGKGIIAVNHSFATYDIALLGAKIYEYTGRIPFFSADRWFFKSETIALLFESMNMFEGTRGAALKVLNSDELMFVAPGGMLEAVQTRPGSICWENRKGFIKVAIETQSPIILCACPKADGIYKIMGPQIINDFFYKKFKLPITLLRGLGPTPIPRPVKLTHNIAKPLSPPAIGASSNDIEDFHKQVTTTMKGLMNYKNDT